MFRSGWTLLWWSESTSVRITRSLSVITSCRSSIRGERVHWFWRIASWRNWRTRLTWTALFTWRYTLSSLDIFVFVDSKDRILSNQIPSKILLLLGLLVFSGFTSATSATSSSFSFSDIFLSEGIYSTNCGLFSLTMVLLTRYLVTSTVGLISSPSFFFYILFEMAMYSTLWLPIGCLSYTGSSSLE